MFNKLKEILFTGKPKQEKPKFDTQWDVELKQKGDLLYLEGCYNTPERPWYKEVYWQTPQLVTTQVVNDNCLKIVNMPDSFVNCLVRATIILREPENETVIIENKSAIVFEKGKTNE